MSTHVASRSALRTRAFVGPVLTLALAVLGLFFVKWSPYYAKTLVAAAHRTLGTSILAAGAAEPGLNAAGSYALAYYRSVWQALLLALLLGASIQVLIPRAAIARRLGTFGIRSASLAGAFGAASMMCTCCTAPVAASLHKQRASVGAVAALFVATPALNPAVLVFIGLVLSWQLATLRLIAGFAIVVACAILAHRFLPDDALANEATIPIAPIENPALGPMAVARAWFRALIWEVRVLLPGYAALVLALGAARQWIFPHQILTHGTGPFAVLFCAVVGALFVIPTGGEVAIVQSATHLGLGIGPAAALLVTLPVVSLPSLVMMRGVFPPRLSIAIGAIAALGGAAAGAAALLLRLGANGS